MDSYPTIYVGYSDDISRLLMLLSEKPQYRNDQINVSDPYQDSSSGQCQMWREREHFDKYWNWVEEKKGLMSVSEARVC